MSAHTIARLRIALLLVGVTVVQTALAADLRVAGVAPDLMVLTAILAGLAGGSEAGAVMGFFSGLLMDMFLASTPVGLSALTYCVIGAIVGAGRASVMPERSLVVPVSALFATAAAVLMFVAFGEILGQGQLLSAGHSWFARVILVESGWNLVLSLPLGWLYARAARGSVGTDRFGLTLGLPRRRERLAGSLGIR
ncbi:MAG TPA: rod shape-determining protein MreD [Acidimicrobiales bacterium]|nr:rod shape-determining protein MreD [Acidimicrobiales bacterium]